MMAEVAIMLIAGGSMWALICVAGHLARIADELKKWNDELTR